MASLEYVLNNKKKRHILGGILMSMSLMFAGLSITVITLKREEQLDEQEYIE
jgi:hypothetical protein